MNHFFETRRVIPLSIRAILLASPAIVLGTTGVLRGQDSVVQAATPAGSANSTLSFRVTARFAAREAGRNTAQPQQVLAARVFLKGQRARIETRMSDRPIVFLLAAPYAFKLLPQAKAGVRWRVNRNAAQGMGGLNLQSLLRNPASLRGTLQRASARKVGSVMLNGTPSDVWTARNLGGQSGTTKVWLRRSDGLPLRLEAISRTLATTFSWSDYRRNRPLSDALFRSPAGYSVRDSAGQPKLF
ncbi:MAG TPA: hypothetical protein VF600_15055 [Abditibacteriaceae bacterium]